MASIIYLVNYLKDSSEDFGNEFINKILPNLIGEDKENIIKKETICKMEI